MSNEKDRKSIHAKLDEDLHRKVRIEAAKQDVSMAGLTRQALREFVVEYHEEDGGTCVPDGRLDAERAGGQEQVLKGESREGAG